MAAKTVYIETSIVSYLTARPTGDLVAAAWQKATLDWWDTQRGRFALFVSDVVIEEAGKGDAEAAARRLEALVGIPLLRITDNVVSLSKALMLAGAVPERALGDSLHIAVSAAHGIDYLLTWNCRPRIIHQRSGASTQNYPVFSHRFAFCQLNSASPNR
jgi:predicted nucleic acid-binding protein